MLNFLATIKCKKHQLLVSFEAIKKKSLIYFRKYHLSINTVHKIFKKPKFIINIVIPICTIKKVIITWQVKIHSYKRVKRPSNFFDIISGIIITGLIVP